MTFSKLADNQGLTWRVLFPKPAMKLLVLGLRNIRLFGLYYPPGWYTLGAKQWNFDVLRQHLGYPSSFPKRDPYLARRRFDDITHYVNIQLSAVVMENLFIQQAALELRSSPFAARFFTPSRSIRGKCMAIIDLGGENLSDKYHGILDNYLECGQDVAVCFRPPPPSHIRGSTKARKVDKPVWVGRFVTAPRQFQREIPRVSLCVLIYLSPDHPPPVAIADVGTYSGYNSNLPTYEVYLRLEDTSKAARRNFNGIARLAPPPIDNDWIRDGDSEADLTGVQPHLAGASRGHSLMHAAQDASGVTGQGADTFRSLLCGMTAAGYFEFDMLSGVESATKDRILAGIHHTRRAQRVEFMSRIPCATLLIHGAPGCGKSEQLAGCITLCVAQNMPVLLTASRHEAVDACLRKVEVMVKTSGLDCTIIRAFDAAEDKEACKRVFRYRNQWRNAEFRVRSKWRPHLSVAFWVAYYLGMESSPWTDRHLDATTAPQCFHDAQHMARQLDDAPDDMPESQKSRLRNTFSVHLDKCIDHIYSSALLVAVTPYAALGKMVKWFTRNRASVLAVDEAAAIVEAHVLQCVYNQSVFLFAFDPQQLPTFSASKTSPIVPRVNTYEDQYICSLAERLYTLEWPIMLMDQQFRMLPGLFDPARDVFYQRRAIQDVTTPDADAAIAHNVEMWVMDKGGSPPQPGKYWPVFVDIRGTKCEKLPDSKSSINKAMWKIFFDKVLWPDFLSPGAPFHVDWNKLCILTPYRAMTNHIQDFLHERGLDLTTDTLPFHHDDGVPDQSQDENLAAAMSALVVAEDPDDSNRPDGPEPTVRTHKPMSLDCATIDSYQGQEKDIVFSSSTVSASSGPKFVAIPNCLCVAFNHLWYWFCKNNRVVELDASSA